MTNRSQVLIAALLEEYRAYEGLSQRALARKLGYGVGYMNSVLQGNANLTLKSIEHMSDILGIALIEVPLSIKPKRK